MRNDVLKVLAMIFFTLNLDVYGDGRPEVSICQPGESNNQHPDYQDIEDNICQLSRESRDHISRISYQNALVMKNYDLLANELDLIYRKEKSLKAEEMQCIFNAMDFAAEKHRLQTRKNKDRTPYISHPLGVAYYLIHYGEVSDSAVIIGAILHDTVEDTQTTFDEIENKFGIEVASYVREMTDEKTLASAERKRLQVIDASKKSKGAAQISLADKLYNVLDLLHNPPEGWSRIRIERYYQWTQAVIDRLPEANEKLKKETQKIINSYWENQKNNRPLA